MNKFTLLVIVLFIIIKSVLAGVHTTSISPKLYLTTQDCKNIYTCASRIYNDRFGYYYYSDCFDQSGKKSMVI